MDPNLYRALVDITVMPTCLCISVAFIDAEPFMFSLFITATVGCCIILVVDFFPLLIYFFLVRGRSHFGLPQRQFVGMYRNP